jgi:UDP-3-O-[3-hydroxymyristoyl] glucosamine N-acyltransferase
VSKAVFCLAELATGTGARLVGDGTTPIRRVTTLEEAGEGDITFLANERYRPQLASTKASAVILGAGDLDACPTNALVSANPYLCYARVSALLHPQPSPVPGVHASAVVAPTARIDATAEVGPLCVIGEHVEIGAGVVVGPASVVQSHVHIGAHTRLVASVALCEGVRIGERCLVHPGVVIGSDGFGLANDGGVWVKVPQLGGVVIGNDVEIGANTTIDRGSLRNTVIDDGAKLDNLIQVAHNVSIGAHTAIAACSGIAGSTTIGRHCTLAGNTGIAGHLEIGDDVHFSGMSLVTRSHAKAGSYSGNLPAMPTRVWRRVIGRIRHIDELFQRVKRLELAWGQNSHARENPDD